MSGKRVDYDRVAELNGRGWSAARIAAELGCAAETVHRWRSREGLRAERPAHGWRPASPERLARAEQMLDDGASYQEVHRTLGMTLRTLHRHFPGRQWSRHESGVFAAMVTHMNREINRKAAA